MRTSVLLVLLFMVNSVFLQSSFPIAGAPSTSSNAYSYTPPNYDYTSTVGGLFTNPAIWTSTLGNVVPNGRTMSSNIIRNGSVLLNSTTPIFNFQLTVDGFFQLSPSSSLNLIPFKPSGPCDAVLNVEGGIGENLNLIVTTRTDPNNTFEHYVYVLNVATQQSTYVILYPGFTPGTYNATLFTQNPNNPGANCNVTNPLCVGFGDQLNLYYTSSCTPTTYLTATVFVQNCQRYGPDMSAGFMQLSLLKAALQRNINNLLDLQNNLINLYSNVDVDYSLLHGRIDMSAIAESTFNFSSTCLDSFSCSLTSFVAN